MSDPVRFEFELFTALNCSRTDFENLRVKMREYRDKFLAHLDSEFTMHVPELGVAEASAKFYHEYLVANEASPGDLVGLPDSTETLSKGYEESEAEAALAYRFLENQSSGEV